MELSKGGGRFKNRMLWEGEDQIPVGCQKRGRGGIFNFLCVGVMNLFQSKPLEVFLNWKWFYNAKKNYALY